MWKLVSASVFCSCATTLAHECWLQPDSFRPATGTSTPLRILVGDGWPGENRPRTPKLERLDLIPPGTDTGPQVIQGRDGDEPVGSITPDKPGVYAAVYRGKESIITLEAAKFEVYLRECGLDEALKQRTELKESGSPGRESYSRCAKTLLCSGSDPTGAWNVRAGLTLEVVPVTNPYAAHAGDTLEFLLLENGKPAAGAQLTAITAAPSGQTLRTTARTNTEGKASFQLKQPGVWLINTVRMKRAQNRADADWVSVWSSLSFDLAE